MNFLDRKFLRVPSSFWLVVLLFLIFSTLYSTLSIFRHIHFQSQGSDFTIYDQSLWLYSKNLTPFSTVTSKLDLADRFRPIMILISYLYKFTGDEKILLIFQAVMLSATVFPIWLFSKRHVTPSLSIVISFLYLDFVGTQSPNVYDFHELFLLPFLLAWLFYFFEKKRWLEYLIMLLLFLSVREYVGLMFVPLLPFFLYRRQLRVGFVSVVISLLWSLSAIFLIMPHLGQNNYGGFVKSGDGLDKAALSYFFNPVFILKNYFLPIEKLKTILFTFSSFGFLALADVIFIPAIIWLFAIRFLDQLHPIRWTLFYQYNLETSVLFSISSVFGAKFLLRKFGQRFEKLLIISILIFNLGTNLYLHVPLKNLTKGDFYKNKPWMNDTELILNQIPQDVSVAAQNNLLPHLGHRTQIYLLPQTGHSKYIMFDLHEGQDNWNFYSENRELATKQFIDLVKSGEYKIDRASGDSYLLVKI